MNAVSPSPGAPCAFKGCRGHFYPGNAETGVVLCPPWGLEELAARATWQRLAEAIAAAGYPCLRFDYPGTGASLGSMTGAANIEQWTQAAAAAAGFLRAYSGVKQFAFIGQSLGAAIAMEAAGQRRDVESLILIAPAANGASYAHALTALAGDTSGDLDLGGYILPATMLASLKSLDPLHSSPGGLKTVTVFDRADRKAGAQVSEHYRRLGLASTLEIIAPYRHTGNDSAPNPFPASIHAIVTALTKAHPAGSTEKPARVPCLPATLRATSFREEPLPAGPDGQFRGLLCQPAQPYTDRNVLIVLDEGPAPRAGWRRMAVDLTRALAAAGHASLRLDVHGVASSALPGLVRHALDVLQARGAAGFALAALDRPAGIALRTLDPRISRAVAIDPTGLAGDGPDDPSPDSALMRFALTIAKTLPPPARPHRIDDKIVFFQDLIAAARLHRRLTIRDRALDFMEQRLDSLKAMLPAALRRLILRDPRPSRVKHLFGELARAGTEVSLVYSGEPVSLREFVSHSGRPGYGAAMPGCMVWHIPGTSQDPTAPEAASWLLDHFIDIAHEMAHAAETGHQAVDHQAAA